MPSAGEDIVVVPTDVLKDVPRSRRMGIASPPSTFNLNIEEDEEHVFTSTPPPPASPPLPIRSPLRPLGRSISSSSTMTSSAASTTTTATIATVTTATPSKQQRFRRPATPPPLEIEDSASIVDEASALLTFSMRHRSFSTHLGISLDDSHTGDRPISKTLPPRPDSPSCLSIEDEATSSSSSSIAPQAPMTKRQHALLELLSSERAYASDLALIRDVHIPSQRKKYLIAGEPVLLKCALPSTPPPLSSASSSRTLSVSSDSSSASLGPPMSPEDAKVIFSNISDLAMFSDQFCEGMEEALGPVLEGREGEDTVGALFLEIIPEMEKPYKYYINRHPTALAHLQALPQTPALAAYLQQTQNVASNLSHAWDLASLLIKPVQRLLKYSLLLAAIIDETPDSHGDKDNLKLARTKMEEVARNVNEGRRRAEVVKEVLTAKKKPVNVGVAASVNLTKMKSLRHGSAKTSQLAATTDANGEAVQVERMQTELKRIDVFAQQFAKNVVDWAKMMNNVVLALRGWAVNFGKVIGLSAEQGSEAFDAFLAVIEEQLVPLCHQLESDVNERLLRDIAHLLTSMNQPLKLLASMNEQEPLHYHLLTMNVSAKNRPPASLLAASTNYLALRGQLAAELPTYLALLHRGLAAFVRRLADIQTSFWGNVRDRWAELWEMLRVEGEMNAGHAETVAVWHTRWTEVDEMLGVLNITQARKLYVEVPPPKHTSTTAPNTPPMSYANSPDTSHHHQHNQLQPSKSKSASVMTTLSALEPAHIVGQYVVSAPLPLARGRPRGQSDASGSSKGNSMTRRVSADNVPTSNASAKLTKKRDGFGDFVAPGPSHNSRRKSPAREQQQQQPPIPRTKSMPLPSEGPTTSQRNSSSSKHLFDEGTPERHSQEVVEDDRVHTHRQPSLRRKFNDSLRPSSSGGRQRSSSKTSLHPQPYFDDLDVPVSPPPPPQHQHHQHQQHQRTHSNAPTNTNASTNRDSWVTRRAKYVCRVIHACKPPPSVSYFSFPFFTLVEEELFEVLHEAGHPSLHPKLPLYLDDGEDCLLLCRDGSGAVGWALASFLAPVEGLSFR